MKNYRWACLLLVLLAVASAAPLLAQRPASPPSVTGGVTGGGFPWWKSDPFKNELGLTADQSARIDKIWQTSRDELRQEWDELSAREAKLSRMIQNDADEAVLARQIDRVETARASANKTRALMLVQMLKVLTPEQRPRFNALHDKWQREHRQPEPPAGAQPRRERRN